MKQYYCQSCLLDNHETVGCHAIQLKWEFEDLFMNIPIVGSIFRNSGYSFCKLFEQVDLEDE